MRLVGVIAVLCLLACSGPSKQKEVEVKKEVEIEVRLESHESPVDRSLRGISIVNTDLSFLSGAGGSILRSTDGSVEWELISPPDRDSLDYRDIHAFSENEFIVVSAGYPARVYRTQNSGEEWKLVYENLDSSAFMNSVHFKDDQNGLIIGDVLDGYHFILRTADGGKSWERVEEDKIDAPLEVEHSFAASGSCIALNKEGRLLFATGGESSRVFVENEEGFFKAHDMGWTDNAASSGIYSIASGGDLIMAVGGDYTKADSGFVAYISEDGGQIWNEGGTLNGYRSVVAYSPSNNAWVAAGTNGIDLSLDGGKEWKSIGTTAVNTLQFDGAKGNAILANSKGEIHTLVLSISQSE